MNRLLGQTSPHLLQHAGNPVDWHPWDDEALALAKRENRPILLSIGYSACHSCQRMARESFESNQVAKLMNDDFVSIKVDREERPDLDRIYQTAHGILTRNPGGWPLTMFLDPNDLLPFFGGTYFPPQARKEAPGFRDVLKGMAKTYATQHDKIKEFKPQLHDALAQTLVGGKPSELDETLIERACGQIDGSFDDQHGGFSAAPKFPHPSGLELLLDVALSESDEAKSNRASHMLDFTMAAMSAGGLYDHIGGGFFGYSVDAEWNIPHFEKMLSDNGPLLSLYARRAQQTNSPWFRDVANQTVDWMMRELQLDEGGIACSLNADLEGVEGGFYTWLRDEISTVLGERYDAFSESYGLGNRSNFENKWHLRLHLPESIIAVMEENPITDLTDARSLLFKSREQRQRPMRDEKIVTSWNALGIRALVDVGQQLERTDCIEAATRAVDFLRDTHWNEERLFASSHGGEASGGGFLDDYAFLIDALLVLLSARWRQSDLAFAIDLADAMLEGFEDRESGGFFFTSSNQRGLIQRAKLFSDDSLPAGNGMAVRGLLELGHLLEESRYLDSAERALRAGMSEAERWPSAHATLVRALNDYTTPPPRVVLRCTDGVDIDAWRAAVAKRLPHRARCYVIPATADTRSSALARRDAVEGTATTAYYYSGSRSSAAIADLDSFVATIGN